MSAAVQLQPGVFGLYQARNRVLLPRYGRWAQKDPNASGMLHASLWHDGQAPSPEIAAGSLSNALTDGSNLFAFVGNSPFNGTDPSGRISVFGALSVIGKGMGIVAPWLAASSVYSDVVAYNNNEIAGRDLALGLLVDAILGGVFFKVGGFVDDYFAALAREGSRATVRAVRQFVPDAVAVDAKTYRKWLQTFGNPKGQRCVPKSAIDEVIREGERLGFTNIRFERGGSSSASWKDVWHINMTMKDGGRDLHILTEQ